MSDEKENVFFCVGQNQLFILLVNKRGRFEKNNEKRLASSMDYGLERSKKVKEKKAEKRARQPGEHMISYKSCDNIT